jgi:hypothetical protein
MTQLTDIRRALALLSPARPFRVLDICCCIGGKATVAETRAAKGIDWSTDHLRLREALPPAYTEWIGRAYLATLAPVLEVAA